MWMSAEYAGWHSSLSALHVFAKNAGISSQKKNCPLSSALFSLWSSQCWRERETVQWVVDSAGGDPPEIPLCLEEPLEVILALPPEHFLYSCFPPPYLTPTFSPVQSSLRTGPVLCCWPAVFVVFKPKYALIVEIELLQDVIACVCTQNTWSQSVWNDSLRGEVCECKRAFVFQVCLYLRLILTAASDHNCNSQSCSG